MGFFPFRRAKRRAEPAPTAPTTDQVIVEAVTLRTAGRSEEGLALLESQVALDPLNRDLLLTVVDFCNYAKQPSRKRPYVERLDDLDGGAARGRMSVSSVLHEQGVLPEYVDERYSAGEAPHFFPSDLASYTTLPQLIDPLCDRPGPRAFSARSRLITVGSCFAVHIRTALKARGLLSDNFHVPDGLDNTFAVASFFDWIVNDNDEMRDTWFVRGDDNLIRRYAEDRRQLRESLREADGIIVTYGLSQIWEDRETGHVFWRGIPRKIFDERRHVARLATFEENRKNIVRVIDILKTSNPGSRLIFTLSPVPLKASFYGQNVIVNDCISKSTLRCALHEALVGRGGCHYWPSFEIVRWLSAHVRLTPYGGFDGRHIDDALVEEIVSRFIAEFFERSP